MPVLSAPQRRALMKKQAEERQKKLERAKAAVEKGRKPPKETEQVVEDEVTDASKPDGEQSGQ